MEVIPEDEATFLKQKGHTPILDDGELDLFVFEEGYCNGPGCLSCGFSYCHHCDSLGDTVPNCEHPVLVDPHPMEKNAEYVSKCFCAMECGKQIKDHQDDIGGFYVTTPKYGYAAICADCWTAGGYSTAER